MHQQYEGNEGNDCPPPLKPQKQAPLVVFKYFIHWHTILKP